MRRVSLTFDHVGEYDAENPWLRPTPTCIFQDRALGSTAPYIMS